MPQETPGAVSVLYVEDEVKTRELVTGILVANGFNCIVAGDGREGLELYRRHVPEIVLTDIKMPVMNGLEMARAIREEFPQAEFIFMTAMGDSKYILEAIDIGVSRYIVKPVVIAKLLAAMSHCVALIRLKAVSQRVKQLESIGILAGGLAHDFNNLIQIVLGNVALAKKQLSPDSAAFGYLAEAETISRDARNLGKRLGTLARGESGLRRQTALAPLLMRSVSASLHDTGVTLAFDLPPDLPQVAIDSTQMEQVFSHLTLNAMEAMPSSGKLTVSVRVKKLELGGAALLAPGTYLCITFTDTGKGIPAENLGKIFDPYFTTKEMDFNKGRGLGLSVCHAIISRHGGLITAGNARGAGAVFTVWLPVKAEAAAAADREPRGEADAAAPVV